MRFHSPGRAPRVVSQENNTTLISRTIFVRAVISTAPENPVVEIHLGEAADAYTLRLDVGSLAQHDGDAVFDGEYTRRQREDIMSRVRLSPMVGFLYRKTHRNYKSVLTNERKQAFILLIQLLPSKDLSTAELH